MSQGSLKELETHVIIAERLGFASKAEAELVLSRCDEVGRMIRGLVRSLQEKAQSNE